MNLDRVKYLLAGMKQRHDERLVVFTEINELYRILAELVAELEKHGQTDKPKPE